jgi:glutaminyl-tRNA synthetase
VKCTAFEKDANGKITKVLCEYLPDTKSGTPGSDSVKVKGNIHWVSKAHSYRGTIRLYDKLFSAEHPGSGDTNYLECLNPSSCEIVEAELEETLKEARPGDQYQFERHGYFIADIKDSKLKQPIFNRTVTLRDIQKRS